MLDNIRSGSIDADSLLVLKLTFSALKKYWKVSVRNNRKVNLAGGIKKLYSICCTEDANNLGKFIDGRHLRYSHIHSRKKKCFRGYKIMGICGNVVKKGIQNHLLHECGGLS